MAELFGGLILTIAGGVTLAALLALLPLLLPGLAEHVYQAQVTVPGRAFALGLVNFLFLGVLAAVSAQVGQALGGFFGGLFGLAALAIFWVLLALALTGAAGLVLVIARRMRGADPKERVPAGSLLRAAVLLAAAALAPVVGWFVFLPLALFLAMGAAILALVQWARPRPGE